VSVHVWLVPALVWRYSSSLLMLRTALDHIAMASFLPRASSSSSPSAPGVLCRVPTTPHCLQVELLRDNGDGWLYGRCRGQEGLLPGNYVQIVTPIPFPAPAPAPAPAPVPPPAVAPVIRPSGYGGDVFSLSGGGPFPSGPVVPPPVPPPMPAPPPLAVTAPMAVSTGPGRPYVRAVLASCVVWCGVVWCVVLCCGLHTALCCVVLLVRCCSRFASCTPVPSLPPPPPFVSSSPSHSTTIPMPARPSDSFAGLADSMMRGPGSGVAPPSHAVAWGSPALAPPPRPLGTGSQQAGRPVVPQPAKPSVSFSPGQ
jgi:hypothetical protein